MSAVLVIETDRFIGSLLEVLLRRAGFDVDVLPHETAALRNFEQLECREYAAIVVQVTPHPSPVDSSVATGMALLREMERKSPECLPKTIVLTTHHDRFISELAKVCHVVIEPFDAYQFVSEVKSCVSANDVCDVTNRIARPEAT